MCNHTDRNCAHSSTDIGKTALAAMLGAVVGAVTALLLAPKSGEETREDLKGMANKARVELEKDKELLKKTGQDVKETIKKNFK